MSATLASLIKDAAARLEGVTDTPRLDAEILLAHALKMPRARLLASLQEGAAADNFEPLIERRAAGEPIAYILGSWEFFSRTFIVEAPVLVPRPETEHLVEVVAAEVGEKPAEVLEIGTGTGCVAISIACECRNAAIVATDIRPGNLVLAERNARRHEVEPRITFVESDLFEKIGGDFDVICSNPPYIADSDWPELSETIRNYEDRAALTSGEDGLEVIRRLIAQAPQFLRADGLLTFEFGSGQRPAIESLLLEAGYRDIRFVQDLSGIDRIAAARSPR